MDFYGMLRELNSFLKWWYPNSWMVDFRQNHKIPLKWRMTGGSPMTKRKAPSGSLFKEWESHVLNDGVSSLVRLLEYGNLGRRFADTWNASVVKHGNGKSLINFQRGGPTTNQNMEVVESFFSGKLVAPTRGFQLPWLPKGETSQMAVKWSALATPWRMIGGTLWRFMVNEVPRNIAILLFATFLASELTLW